MKHLSRESKLELWDLRREKGDRIKGALQATRDPNVPNNNTGIILSIIPVLILVIIYYSSSIENTASIIYYCTFIYYTNAIVICIQVLL